MHPANPPPVPPAPVRPAPVRPAPVRPAPASPFALWAIVGLCCVIEAGLLAADHGVWGSPRWRGLAYQYGGFWAGLLRDWRPNYAVQPILMFATYGWLHTGISHLAGNMLGLWGLGMIATDRLGTRGFVALYGTSGLGAGLMFGLLSNDAAAMVGASGAIFGLAGAWTVWDRNSRRAARLWDRSLVLLAVGIGINVAMWWSAAGQLAWQAHLGGALTGAAFAALYPRLAKMRS